MTVTLLLLVKDEADIIDSNLRWHRSLGIEQIIVTDNGSTDGTLEILKEWERAHEIKLISNDGPFRQDELTTSMVEMAREIWNPDWVISGDADELFEPRSRNWMEELEESPHSLLHVPTSNFIPTAYDDPAVTDPVCRMQYRVTRPLPVPRIPELLKKASMGYSGKVIVRPTHVRQIQNGNTSAAMIGGTGGKADNLLINHFPIRSRDHFFSKVIRGAAALKSVPEYDQNLAYHWRRWYRQYEAGQLDAEWRRLCPGKVLTTMLASTGVIRRDPSLARRMQELSR